MSNRRLSDDLRMLIVKERENGVPFREIAKKFSLSATGAKKNCDKYTKFNSVSNLRKCGRPRKTTTRENRLICREVKSNSATSSRQIKESLSLDVSSRTIRRRLNEEGIHSYFN